MPREFSSVTRRAFLVGSAAVGTSLAFPAGGGLARTTVPAARFHASLGVNVHAWYPDNGWQERLAELGILNIRAKVATNKQFLRKLEGFLEAGGKIDATIVHSRDPQLNRAEAAKNLRFLAEQVGTARLCGIEGPNEYNGRRWPDWARELRQFVRWLHERVRADPVLARVPLIAPSIWGRVLADYRALGDISPYVDKGCIHFYSGARRPTLTSGNSMAGALADASSMAPGKPIWMTESGWQAPSGRNPVSLRAQAKYILRDYFDAFALGVEKLFIYQLVDDQPNQFGICASDGRPKPAYHALRNLAALMRDEGENKRQLVYSVADTPAQLKSLAFSRTDGSFLLALYLDVESYDPRSRHDIESEVPVTVELAVPARQIDVYQPTFDGALRQRSSGRRVRLPALDQVSLLDIRF